MPKFLLDTNICIYIIKRLPDEVVQRMDQCKLGDVAMSSITFAELESGVLCAADPTALFKAAVAKNDLAVPAAF